MKPQTILNSKRVAEQPAGFCSVTHLFLLNIAYSPIFLSCFLQQFCVIRCAFINKHVSDSNWVLAFSLMVAEEEYLISVTNIRVDGH